MKNIYCCFFSLSFLLVAGELGAAEFKDDASEESKKDLHDFNFLIGFTTAKNLVWASAEQKIAFNHYYKNATWYASVLPTDNQNGTSIAIGIIDTNDFAKTLGTKLGKIAFDHKISRLAFFDQEKKNKDEANVYVLATEDEVSNLELGIKLKNAIYIANKEIQRWQQAARH